MLVEKGTLTALVWDAMREVEMELGWDVGGGEVVKVVEIVLGKLGIEIVD